MGGSPPLVGQQFFQISPFRFSTQEATRSHRHKYTSIEKPRRSSSLIDVESCLGRSGNRRAQLSSDVFPQVLSPLDFPDCHLETQLFPGSSTCMSNVRLFFFFPLSTKDQVRFLKPVGRAPILFFENVQDFPVPRQHTQTKKFLKASRSLRVVYPLDIRTASRMCLISRGGDGGAV